MTHTVTGDERKGGGGVGKQEVQSLSVTKVTKKVLRSVPDPRPRHLPRQSPIATPNRNPQSTRRKGQPPRSPLLRVRPGRLSNSGPQDSLEFLRTWNQTNVRVK